MRCRLLIAAAFVVLAGCDIGAREVNAGTARGRGDAPAVPLAEGAPCVDVEGGDGPEKGNDGITLRFCASTLTPTVGEDVTFTVEATDPDAELFELTGCSPNAITFGDEDAHCSAMPSCLAPGRFDRGPAPHEGRLSEQRVHAYAQPGTFRAKVELQSGSQCPHPFASNAVAELELTVVIEARPLG